MIPADAGYELEIARLKKIVTVLMDQVELRMSSEGSDFGLFQTTIMLEAQVRERASQLETALRAIAKSNRELSKAKVAAENATTGLATVIENISEAFILFDADDRLVMCNDIYRQLWNFQGVNIRTGQTFAEFLRLVVDSGLIVGADDAWYAWRMDVHRRDGATSEFLLSDGRWIKTSERRLTSGGTVGIYSDVTEIKRRDQERYDREMARKSRLLQATIDNVSQGVAVFDRDGRLTVWNPRFVDLLRLPPEQAAIGVSSESLLPRDGDESNKAADPSVAGVFEHQTAWNTTLDVRHNPMPDGGCVVTFTDITERKAAESALMHYAAIVESSDDAIIGSTLGGIVTSWNNGAERMYGYTRDEMVGRHIHTLVPQAYRSEEEHIRERISQGNPVKHYQAMRARKDGSLIHISVTVSPLLDAKGKVVGLSKVARDITEQKRAEQEYRIAATAFETQEGIVITDADGVILRVNKAFTEITGYTPEEAVGRTPRILKSNRHEPAFYEAMWSAIRTTGVWQGEIWDRRKSGEVYPKWLTITAVTGEKGEVTHYVGTHMDITQRKAAEEEIRHLAFYDPLTLLPNRRLLMDRLRHSLAASARTGSVVAVLFIDLDNFKDLNDTLGHDKGDVLLTQVAQRLVTCVREGDTVARLGGDEFVVMLEYQNVARDKAATLAQTVGEKVLATLSQPYTLLGHVYHSTASIGITLYSDQQGSVDELLKQADLAMYQAKAVGRNALRFFDTEMQEAATSRAVLESSLRRGLQRKEFTLYYQPQVDSAGRLTGAEALVRWRHPKLGLVPPMDFIPFAEQSGLILPLGQWVLETACKQLAAWADVPQLADLSIAVNVSARQFRQANFVEQVLNTLDKSGANPHHLKLELTESLLLDDVEATIGKMAVLKGHGISFSLDDFGTGYSSLSYLKDLPIDQLKIDQSFIRDVLTDPSDAAIAHTIVALGKNLGLMVLAEGVETDAQRHFLSNHGCHAYQGFLFCRPLPPEECERFLMLARELS